MEKETPWELAQIEIKKEEEMKKHWWNFKLKELANIFRKSAKMNNEANKNKEQIVDELEVVDDDGISPLEIEMKEKVNALFLAKIQFYKL